MKIIRSQKLFAIALRAAAAFTTTIPAAPLPSWNDSPAKQSIISFVEKKWSWPSTPA